MFLLILVPGEELSVLPYTFTFHYVSINTTEEQYNVLMDIALHSTMFLLILLMIFRIAKRFYLYIPLCFY